MNSFVYVISFFLSAAISLYSPFNRISKARNANENCKISRLLPLKFDFQLCVSLCFAPWYRGPRWNSSPSPAVCFRHFTLSELLLLHFHFHNFFFYSFFFACLTFIPCCSIPIHSFSSFILFWILLSYSLCNTWLLLRCTMYTHHRFGVSEMLVFLKTKWFRVLTHDREGRSERENEQKQSQYYTGWPIVKREFIRLFSVTPNLETIYSLRCRHTAH